MSNTNAWFGPLKAACQATLGQWDDARTSWREWKEGNPFVLLTRGGYHACRGNREKAAHLVKKGGRNSVSFANGAVNAIPLVGHAKGIVHYAVGDKDGGHKAMKSSSRTTGGMIGGAAGFVTAGPVGAVGGYMAGTTTMDGVISSADSAVHGEKRLHGNVANLDAFRKKPTIDKGFEVCAGFGLDCLAGLAVGASDGLDVDAGGSSSADDAAGVDDVGGSDYNADSNRRSHPGEDNLVFGDEVKMCRDITKVFSNRVGHHHVDDGRSLGQEIIDALPDDLKLPGRDDPALDLTAHERMDHVAHMKPEDAVGMLIPNKRDFLQELERGRRK